MRKGLILLPCLWPCMPLFAAETTRPISQPLFTSGMTQMITGLVLVVAAILVVTWVVKRVPGMQATGKGTIRIIDAMHVGSRDKVLLIQVGDEQLLVGVTAQNINTLHRLSEPVIREDNQHEMANRLVKLFSNRNTGKVSPS